MVVRLKSTNEKSIDNHNNAKERQWYRVNWVNPSEEENQQQQQEQQQAGQKMVGAKANLLKWNRGIRPGQETNQRVNNVKRTNSWKKNFVYLYIDNKNVDVAQTLCSWERSKLKQKEPNKRTNSDEEKKNSSVRRRPHW